ncbi:hypothetical protein [Bacillus sp. LL01]|uniref:hypothetical protein n=1 Tax=Bacillus sp. LL01 TaxID=1665556 RepID=UPI000AAC07A3|nr:hypothetical protein [Bacillus sp. LL01]
MDIATLFIDLWRNIKGFFFNEEGILDKTRMITGSAVILFLIVAIGYLSYRFFV